MVWRVEEGSVESGVFLVRRLVRDGNVVGMGFRKWRSERWVDDRSRVERLGNTKGSLDEVRRDWSGLPRRDSVFSFGREARLAMSDIVSMLLADRSSLVRDGRFRGLAALTILLAETDNDFKDGKFEVIATISCHESKVLPRPRCSIRRTECPISQLRGRLILRNRFPL